MPPKQRRASQSDGSLVAEFRLDGTREIKSWVLSFGRHAEVLGPAELRGEVGEEVEEMLKAYKRMSGDENETQPGRRKGETHV